jgi:hypothetical protein
MARNRIPGIVLILIAIAIMGCDKYNLANNKEKILGTWISLDKSDTLDIVDDSNFYKSTSHMHYDRYLYELFVDSIKIGYSGILYIAVKPTNHKYFIDEDKLTIDFSNRNCYGFSNQETIYTKE